MGLGVVIKVFEVQRVFRYMSNAEGKGLQVSLDCNRAQSFRQGNTGLADTLELQVSWVCTLRKGDWLKVCRYDWVATAGGKVMTSVVSPKLVPMSVL